MARNGQAADEQAAARSATDLVDRPRTLPAGITLPATRSRADLRAAADLRTSRADRRSSRRVLELDLDHLGEASSGAGRPAATGSQVLARLWPVAAGATVLLAMSTITLAYAQTREAQVLPVLQTAAVFPTPQAAPSADSRVTLPTVPDRPRLKPNEATTPKPTAPTTADTTATPTARPKTTTPPPVSSDPLKLGSARSGLAWASGVFEENPKPANVQAFEAWRGRPVDVVVTWSDRDTWQDVESPDHLYQLWQSTKYSMVFGVPILPTGESGLSLRSCANGDYNSHWGTYATTIKKYGLDDSTIRLGWEFNGAWYPWAATEPAVFAECWRQIVSTAEKIAPRLRWDWNVNRGLSSGLDDPTRAWPGDSYVDYVGVDSYDYWPGANTAAAWTDWHLGASTQGLQYWATFARAHGKLLTIPEWGSRPAGPNMGGDNPYYVDQMYAFFTRNAGIIAYESNFQSADGKYEPSTKMPSAAAAYRQAYGS